MLLNGDRTRPACSFRRLAENFVQPTFSAPFGGGHSGWTKCLAGRQTQPASGQRSHSNRIVPAKVCGSVTRKTPGGRARPATPGAGALPNCGIRFKPDLRWRRSGWGSLPAFRPNQCRLSVSKKKLKGVDEKRVRVINQCPVIGRRPKKNAIKTEQKK